jgi:hypothetical protein
MVKNARKVFSDVCFYISPNVGLDEYQRVSITFDVNKSAREEFDGWGGEIVAEHSDFGRGLSPQFERYSSQRFDWFDARYFL